MAIVRGVGCSKLNFLIAALVRQRNNVFEPREDKKPLVVHQLEEDQRQNRASCIY